MIKKVKNPNRSRKFGWGYSFYSTNDGVEVSDCPKHEGTINQCIQAQREDKTYQAHASNAMHSWTWFYDSRRIVKFLSPESGEWEYPDRSMGNFPPDPMGDELQLLLA